MRTNDCAEGWTAQINRRGCQHMNKVGYSSEHPVIPEVAELCFKHCSIAVPHIRPDNEQQDPSPLLPTSGCTCHPAQPADPQKHIPPPLHTQSLILASPSLLYLPSQAFPEFSISLLSSACPPQVETPSRALVSSAAKRATRFHWASS